MIKNLFLKNRLPFVFFLFCTGWISQGFTQPYSTYVNRLEVFKNNTPLPSPTFVEVPTVQGLNKSIGKASLKVGLSLGPIYKYGDKAMSKDFKSQVVFKLSAYDANGNLLPNVFEQNTYKLEIDNNKTNALLYKDITSFKTSLSSSDEVLVIKNIKIENIVVTNSGSIASIVQNDVLVDVAIEIDYGVDVRGEAVSIVPLPQIVQGGRVVRFSWNNNNKLFPNYQFQLLRLYNNNPGYIADEKRIKANSIDWSKALTLETEGSNTSLDITVAEGTGYYIWRVRPVGTYFRGGIANPKNVDDSKWTPTPPSNDSLSIASPSNGFSQSNAIFFFVEPDKSRNWIYGRSFSEGNKISEQITYATGLQQQKQKQAYLKSKNTTVITQNIYDYSGRPAVSTMPAPVVGNGINTPYKTGFAKNKNDSLYSAKNFDTDYNYNQPDSIKQAATEYLSYYSENNPDLTIPSAEGYPFTRVLYYNDGQNRVKEQSGVGKTHMIGRQNGMGRTVKTIYGTPSDDELIRLFGSEAPDNEGVIKTVTVDQNGTASVSYTSRDGKVIATALTFKEKEDSLLLPLDGEAGRTNPTLVNDYIKNNLKSDSGFTSTKRLVLLDSSAVGLSYNIACPVFERLCDNVSVDCKYKVRIRIHNIDNQTIVYNGPLTSLSLVPCVTNDTLGSGTFKIVRFGSITLPPGTYVVQKSLYSDSNPNIAQSEAADRIDKQIKPISDLITRWLDSVDCERELNTFYVSLDSLASAFSSHKLQNAAGSNAILNNPPASSGSLPFNFSQEFKDSVFKYRNLYSMEIMKSGGLRAFARIVTPCCFIKIPIDWTPPLRCPAVVELNDRNGDNKLTVNPRFGNQLPPGQPDLVSEVNPDFEGYALNYLRSCPILRATNPNDDTTFATFETFFYNNFMKGWPKGTFNLMVYHMLTDEYNCSNKAGDTTKPINPTTGKGTVSTAGKKYDECGNLIAQPSQNGVENCNSKTSCKQYVPQDLVDCWVKQLKIFKEIACNGVGISMPRDANVSEEFDDSHRKNTPGETNHNNQFDDNFKMTGLKFLDWILSKAVSTRARENQKVDLSQSFDQKSPYNRHLVKDFLECTGYRFAKIITPVVSSRAYEASPLPQDSVRSTGGNSFNYLTSNGCNKSLTYEYKSINEYSDIYGTNNAFKKGALDVYYVPFINWKVTPSSSSTTDVFPLIRNPVFAFKYFEYINVNNQGQPLKTYNSIELSSCYRDYNDCIDYDANCNMIYIPCMEEAYVNNADFCFKDYTYPNLAGINDATVGLDGTGKFKKTVSDFCDKGRVRCPYTHEFWSCGQRFTFYQTIKNVKAEPNAIGDYYDGSIPETSCAVNIVPGRGFKDNLGNDISYVDYQANIMTQSCRSNCNSQTRRMEFEREIRNSLKKSCYVIGACAGGDSVLQEEDVRVMVDSLVKQCQYQCPITTYSCYDKYCRDINIPANITGPSTYTLKPKMEFGVGGATTDHCSLLLGSTTKNCQIIANSELSYKEYTLWKQASEWAPDIFFECKCRNIAKCPVWEGGQCATNNYAKDGTYMEQKDYLLRYENNVPLDLTNVKVNDPVYSPSIKKTFIR